MARQCTKLASVVIGVAALVGCQTDDFVPCESTPIDALADADDTWRGFSANDVLTMTIDAVQVTTQRYQGEVAADPALAGSLQLNALRTGLKVVGPLYRVRLDRSSCRRGGKAMRFDTETTWQGTLDGQSFTSTNRTRWLAHSLSDVYRYGPRPGAGSVLVTTTGDADFLAAVEVQAAAGGADFAARRSEGCSVSPVVMVSDVSNSASAGVSVSDCPYWDYFPALE